MLRPGAAIEPIGDHAMSAPRSNPNVHHIWVLLAGIALLAGCGGVLTPRAQDPDLHVLAARPAPKPPLVKPEVVLEVSVPRAYSGYDTPRMAYVQKPFVLDYYADNRWADAPAHMVGSLLTQALERSGNFRAVVQAPTAIPADIRVNTELVRLQQSFATKPSRAELAFRVQLIDVRARRVLATRSFEETENATSEDAAGGVAAANVALERVLEQIVEFCVVETANRSAATSPRP